LRGTKKKKKKRTKEKKHRNTYLHSVLTATFAGCSKATTGTPDATDTTGRTGIGGDCTNATAPTVELNETVTPGSAFISTELASLLILNTRKRKVKKKKKKKKNLGIGAFRRSSSAWLLPFCWNRRTQHFATAFLLMHCQTPLQKQKRKN
jgi:hypothetical protein